MWGEGVDCSVRTNDEVCSLGMGDRYPAGYSYTMTGYYYYLPHNDVDVVEVRSNIDSDDCYGHGNILPIVAATALDVDDGEEKEKGSVPALIHWWY